MKKLKIIIPVLVIIAALAVGGYFLITSGKIALTGKSKAENGLLKSLNTLEATEDIFETSEAMDELKDLSEKPFEASVKVNFDASVDGLDLVLGKEASKLVEDILKELSTADFKTKFAMDKKEKKALLEMELDAKDILGTISGDVVISEDEIAFRSKELNEDYIVLKKEDAEEFDMEEAFDAIKEFFDANWERSTISEEDINYLKDTYKNVLRDYITDEMVKEADGKYKVNNEEKDCTVTTVTLNNDQVKGLVKKYIDTYKNDKKGQEIIKNTYASLYGKELADEIFEDMDDSLEDADEIVDEIEDTTIEFITYGTIKDVYGVSYRFIVDGEALEFNETFNNDSVYVELKVEDESIIDGNLKATKDSIDFDGNVYIEGANASVKFYMDKTKLNLEVSVAELGSVKLTVDTEIKADSDKEKAEDSKITLSVDVPSAKISGDIKISVSDSLKYVKSLELPDTSKGVSLKDNEKGEKYLEKCEKALNGYVEKLEKSKIYSLFAEYLDDSTSSYGSNNYSSSTNSSTSSSSLKADKDTLKKDIEKWYKGIDFKNTKKTKAVENDMISMLDFTDLVLVTPSISWKSGAEEDKGFVEIDVEDYDENTYKFFVDVSSGKVYEEKEAPAEVKSVTWNKI